MNHLVRTLSCWSWRPFLPLFQNFKVHGASNLVVLQALCPGSRILFGHRAFLRTSGWASESVALTCCSTGGA
eukprot:4762055-Amphidinium_carterae.1